MHHLILKTKLVNILAVFAFTWMLCFPALSEDGLPGNPLTALVTDYYDAFSKGDVERLTQLSSKDIVWEAQSSLPTSGTFVGIDAVISNVFEKIRFYAPDFTIKPMETYQTNNVVFVVISVRVGDADDIKGMHVFFFEDRKIVRYMGFLDTLAVMSAITRLPD